jgi:GNAT superfamily N-acetyltransferase
MDSDVQRVGDLVQSTGFFSADEIQIAVELVSERVSKGKASGYFFIFAEKENTMIGYSCYGPIPATQFSIDLYWIAVDKSWQGKGIGRLLLEESEKTIAKSGGQRIYIETAGRPQYKPTREFYLSCGYQEVAYLEHFYAPDDAKHIYLKCV